MEFRLITPHELLDNWPTVSQLLQPAVAQANGEVALDDVRGLVLAGKMFICVGMDDGKFVFATTLEFVHYPRKTILLVGFGAGGLGDNHDACWDFVTQVAHKGGATAVQAYVKHPRVAAHLTEKFGVQPLYTVLERTV